MAKRRLFVYDLVGQQFEWIGGVEELIKQPKITSHIKSQRTRVGTRGHEKGYDMRKARFSRFHNNLRSARAGMGIRHGLFIWPVVTFPAIVDT